MTSTSADDRAGRRPFAAFYGDDFTGSTDALFQYDRFGLRSTLFVTLPSEAQLRAAAERYDVIGVAGIARSLPTQRIAAEIEPSLRAFARLAPEVVQYKICSTFDSSATVGSFAPFIALAREVWGASGLAVVPAQPEFGRYTLFANHFARAGAPTFRLDRHPTMSRHPSTPIDEADLRRYLERQTGGSVVGLDIVTLRGAEPSSALDALHRLRADGPVAVVFDALEDADLIRIGRLLRADSQRGTAPLVALGSGGLGYGLSASRFAGEPRGRAYDPLACVDKLIVVSGSCAPQTAAQIQWALAHGWRGVRVDPIAWLGTSPASLAERIAAVAAEATDALAASERGVVVYSALGPDDRSATPPPNAEDGELARVLGAGLGQIVRTLFARTGLRRAIVSGGDTSGYATRALGVQALEIALPLVPAGAVCRAIAPGLPDVDGAEILLKGGQVGMPELFEIVRTADPRIATAPAPSSLVR